MTPCRVCAHFKEQMADGKPTCAAFPSGIPLPIFYGQQDHAQPVEGDGGITFRSKYDVEGSTAITDHVISQTAPDA